MDEKYRRQWKSLEQRVIDDSVLLGRPFHKIPESILVVKGKPIRKKSLFDFFGTLDCGKTCVFDTKKTEKSFFLFSEHISPKAKRFHQFLALVRFDEKPTFAGYLVWFFNDQKIGFITIRKIKEFVASGKNKITKDDIFTMDDFLPIDLQIFYDQNK